MDELMEKLARMPIEQQENLARILNGVLKLVELPDEELQRRMDALRKQKPGKCAKSASQCSSKRKRTRKSKA
jgi:hypothetical protein